MKEVLIFNGSPRPNGDTEQLISILKGQLKDCNISKVDTYRAKISPCVDCRYCWEKPECCIKDDMQEVYEKIQTADWIILASPVHYAEVSGSLLQVMSRLQPFWMAKQHRGEDMFITKKRQGAAILAAGGTGKATAANAMMKRLLHCMMASDEMVIHCKDTDKLPVAENAEIMEQINILAEKING